MIVSIRPDWCIALRIISLQEFHRQQQELLEQCNRITTLLDKLEEMEDGDERISRAITAKSRE